MSLVSPFLPPSSGWTVQDGSPIKGYFRKEYEKQTPWMKRTDSASWRGQYGTGFLLAGNLIRNVTKCLGTHQKTSTGKETYCWVVLQPGIQGRTRFLGTIQQPGRQSLMDWWWGTQTHPHPFHLHCRGGRDSCWNTSAPLRPWGRVMEGKNTHKFEGMVLCL